MARRGRRPTPGDQVVEEIVRELKRGWPAGVTVLSGDDRYHLDRALDLLLKALVPEDAGEFAINVFDRDKIDISKVVAEARARGMFAATRTVLVRDLAILDGDPEPLVRYAAAPPDGSYLLIRAPKLDQRKKLHKAAAGSGRLLAFQCEAFAGESSLRRVLTRMAEERGLVLENKAAGFLLAVTDGDWYRAEGELEKLRTFRDSADGKPISLETVREVASGSLAMSGWEAADALLSRDLAVALSTVRRLVDAGAEPIFILGGLASRARSMLQAKAMLDSRVPRRTIVNATRAWYFQDELFAGLARYSMDELQHFPALLLNADRTLKSRSLSPRAVLEDLLCRMIGGEGSREVG